MTRSPFVWQMVVSKIEENSAALANGFKDPFYSLIVAFT